MPLADTRRAQKGNSALRLIAALSYFTRPSLSSLTSSMMHFLLLTATLASFIVVSGQSGIW